jgi:homoserine kinase
LDSSNEKIDEFITCSAVAHSSTANLGPGFDVFGLGLDAFEDVVTITKTNKMKSSIPRINLTCSGDGTEMIPSELNENTAGLVVIKMLHDFNLNKNANWDLDLHIVKKIPIGYGLGSSAASAAATALAVDGLFNLQLPKRLLIRYAAEGEIASAGTRHYDNVSGSMLGGFVIVTSTPEFDFIGLEVPESLHLAIAVPVMDVPIKKTAVARGVLPKLVPLESVICNTANASTVVAGFALKNTKMIAKGINDLIVEPSRKHLIPGYELVKRNAIKEGALAVTISGAGPSMISVLEDKKTAIQVANSMAQAFLESGVVDTKTIICRPSGGAKIVHVSK